MNEAANQTPARRGRALLVALQAETGVHAGTGSTISHLDLPIQRESFTKLPIFQASTVKGAMREHFEELARCAPDPADEMKKVVAFFGPEDSETHAVGLGLLQEARLLLLPVRSRVAVYAWVTCPLQLRRLRRDIEGILPFLDSKQQEQAAAFLAINIPDVVVSKAAVAANEPLCQGGSVYLEDYEFTAELTNTAEQLAGWFAKWLYGAELAAESTDAFFKNRLVKQFVILNDDDFLAFAEMHLPVETHVKIGDGGAVISGPWNSEYLPPDSVLSLAVMLPEPFQGTAGASVFPDSTNLQTYFAEGVKTGTRMRLGGNRSLGKGLLRTAILEQEASRA